jgi:hypothetical protein
MLARRGAASWLVLPALLLAGSAGWFALRQPRLDAGTGETPVAPAGGAETADLGDTDGSAPESPASPAVTKGEIAVALLRAGLSADALACAGVNASGVAELIEDAGTHLELHAGSLALADMDYSAARVQVDAIERKAHSGIATKEELGQLATAMTSLAEAEAARETALGALITASTAHLSISQRTTLATIRANGSWSLPTQYLAEHREQADWVKLRDALANQKISAKYGEQADAACQAFLSAAHASPVTASTASNKLALLATVKATWATALH